MTAIPDPDPLQLERGAALGRELHEIAAKVSAWADEATADNADRYERVQLYSGQVLAGLRAVVPDLGVLTMAMAEEPAK